MTLVSQFANADASAKQTKVVAEINAALPKLVWQLTNDNYHWSFDVETQLIKKKGENQTLQRFDIAKPPGQQWTLLQQDRKEPTKAFLKEYNSIHSADSEDSPPDSEHYNKDADSKKFMDVSTLTLVGEQDGMLVLEFQPKLERFSAKINKRLKGKLFVDNQSYKIIKFEIVNTEEISPGTGMTIDEMNYVVEFQDHESGYRLVKRSVYDTKGSAFFFSSFEEKNIKTFSNIKRVERAK